MSLRSGKLPFLGSQDEFLDHTGWTCCLLFDNHGRLVRYETAIERAYTALLLTYNLAIAATLPASALSSRMVKKIDRFEKARLAATTSLFGLPSPPSR
jgi:hypothetical protein